MRQYERQESIDRKQRISPPPVQVSCILRQRRPAVAGVRVAATLASSGVIGDPKRCGPVRPLRCADSLGHLNPERGVAQIVFFLFFFFLREKKIIGRSFF